MSQLDLHGALSLVVHAPPTKKRVSQFLSDPTAVDDALGWVFLRLTQSAEFAAANCGYLTIHRQVIGRLNPVTISYALCRRAAQIGAEGAVNEIKSSLKATSVVCRSTLIAGGPTPESTAEIGDGISLIAYRRAEQSPEWSARLETLSADKNFVESSAPSCIWTKLVSVPIEITVARPQNYCDYPGPIAHLPWGPYVETFQPAIQLTALQEVSVPPAYPILHFIQPDDESFPFGFTYTSAFGLNTPSPPQLLDAAGLKDLRSLNSSLNAMRQKSPTDAERFDQCLRRLHRVFFAGLMDDQAVEARIALETTFTSYGYQRNQKSIVAGNVKGYLGKIFDQRGGRVDPIEIYDALSKPTHGESIGPPLDFASALSGAVSLTRAGLRMTLQNGKQPNWAQVRAERNRSKQGEIQSVVADKSDS